MAKTDLQPLEKHGLKGVVKMSEKEIQMSLDRISALSDAIYIVCKSVNIMETNCIEELSVLINEDVSKISGSISKK